MLLALMIAAADVGEVRHEGEHFDTFAYDEETAAATGAEVDQVVARIEDTFGIDVDPGALVLWREPRVLIHPDADDEYRRIGARWVLFWPETYPHSGEWFGHEFGHLAFGIPAEQGATAAVRRRIGGYGSVLPDWMDEAAAVINEGGYAPFTRDVFFEALDENHTLPLEEFFEMEHPGHIERDAGRSTATERNFLFYGQCRQFITFLREEYGAEFVHDVVREAQQGRGPERALRTLGRRTEGAPRTIAQLEERWLEWARSQPR